MTRESEDVKVSEDTISPIHSERKRSINSDDHSPKSATSKRPRLDLENKEFKDRGKRMLGMIFNTLDKFKKDTTVQSEADKRRKAIENKLQERLKKEKKELEEEIKQDDEIRKKKRIEEEKQRLTDLRNYWNQQNILKTNFIKTKSTPHIYYLPTKLNDVTKKLLEEQKRETLKSINTDPIEIVSPITPTPITATSDHQMKDFNIPKSNEKEMSVSPTKESSSENSEKKGETQKSDNKKNNNDNEESADKINEDSKTTDHSGGDDDDDDDDQESKIDDTMDDIQY